MPRRNLLETLDLEEEAGELPASRPVARTGSARQAILEVPVADLILDSALQTRQDPFDPQRFAEDAELLASVQQFGVIEPVLVQPLPAQPGEQARYRLVFGHRRVAAARQAGRETIPALAAHAAAAVDGLTIAENSGRRELTPYEKALVLARLKERQGAVSVHDLSALTGWPEPTIYALLAAYEKSAPVLRRVFAEGRAAPRTIQAMQLLYERTPATAHEALARALERRTHAEIELLEEAVQSGADPLAELQALQTAQAPAASRESGPEVPRGRPAGAPNRPDPPPPALDPGDAVALREIAEATGATQAAVERLLHLAIAQGMGYLVLFAACLYVARGGPEAQALLRAQAAFTHRKAGAHLRRLIPQLRYLRTFRQWALALPNEEVRGFLLTILGSGAR